MAAPLQVPNQYLALDPVIVAAPTVRCGTTLLQRLLNSSLNAVIYGEEIAAYVASLTQTMVGFLQLCDQIGHTMDADLQAALEGRQDWRPALMPPVSIIQSAWVETFYQIPAALSAYGASIGRPIFGFKRPDLTSGMMRAMLMLMPRARVIYVYRRLDDVLKSAKARKFVSTEAEVAQLCRNWATNLQECAAMASDPRVLFLKYELLEANGVGNIAAIEQFTGAHGVKADVLGVRINTFRGDEAHGHSATQYIEPMPLTASDRAAIREHAGAVMAQLYGAAGA
ncbi:MAG TPA: sulfotransferase [Caulobacteraceae bacterium]|nr:sulfotransferase [Caulobacteraceae bacterium]